MNEEMPFQRHGLGYLYLPVGQGLRFKVDYLSRKSDDLYGQLVVERINGSGWTHVHQGKVLLDGPRSKTEFATRCKLLSEDNTVPWDGLVEDTCKRVLAADRQGEPFYKIGKGARVARPPAIVDPIVPDKTATVIFGPPGTGKGYLCTLLAVCVQAGIRAAGMETQKREVLYLDWEDQREETEARVQDVCTGLGLCGQVEMHYRRPRGPLYPQVHSVASYIADNNIGLVVVDSAEKAIGAAGEHSSHEDRAARLFECFDYFGIVAVLMIDHESKQQQFGDKKTLGTPINSIMKTAWVRSAWQARKEQSFGSPRSQVALYHTKSNRSAQHSPLLFNLDFTAANSVTISRGDIAASEELSKPLPLAERLDVVLAEGRMHTKALSERLEEPENKLRVVLNRYKGRYTHLSDGSWAMAARTEPRDQDEIPF